MAAPSLSSAKRTFLYSPSLYDSVPACTRGTIHECNTSSSHFRVNVGLREGTKEYVSAAMVDSGATALFIHTSYVLKHSIRTFKLKKLMSIYNIDGSHNSAGRIDRFIRVKLTVDGYKHEADLLVTDLGRENIILRLS